MAYYFKRILARARQKWKDLIWLAGLVFYTSASKELESAYGFSMCRGIFLRSDCGSMLLEIPQFSP